jgi:spore maturation protein CgeB
MKALQLILERWPLVHRALMKSTALEGVEIHVSGETQSVRYKGQSLVSPIAPDREAARHLASIFTDEQRPAVLLLGHDMGDLALALLQAGSPQVRMLVPEPYIFLKALQANFSTDLLAHPSFQLELPDHCEETQDLTPYDPQSTSLDPNTLLFEFPFAIRCFPEFVAKQRVELGALRSADYRLKILVAEPIYGGSLSMARSAAEAFRKLGHEVRSLDLSALDSAHRFMIDYSSRRSMGRELSASYTRLLSEILRVEAVDFKPDLLFALAQSPATPELSAHLRQAGIRTAFWFVEDFETLDYWRGLHGHFDFFLTLQRDRFHKELAAISNNPVRYLPCCADTDFFIPSPWNRQDSRPVLSFVGAGYHNRERAFLSLLDLNMKIWGDDWSPRSPLQTLRMDDGQRSTPETNRAIFSNSALNLNLHSSTYHDGVNPRGDFVNPRTFEIAACGGLQLVDERQLLPELMQAGEDLITFSSTQQMKEKILKILEAPDRFASIAARGQQRVLAKHSYTRRMAEFLEMACQSGEGAFPHAVRREAVEAGSTSPELEEILQTLPNDLPQDIDSIATYLRKQERDLSSSELLFLYMSELKSWARDKGIDDALGRT